MFEGTDVAAMAIYDRAAGEARRLGSGFVGGEHLLLVLSGRSSDSGESLRAHGLSGDEIEATIVGLDGVPAAVAADQRSLAAAGIAVDGVAMTRLRPVPPAHGLLPLGWRRGRWWSEQASPPIAGDAVGAYESALWLALARWHRSLGEHHVAEVLLRWSRGSGFVADHIGADRVAAAGALLSAHPPRRSTRTRHLARARVLAA